MLIKSVVSQGHRFSHVQTQGHSVLTSPNLTCPISQLHSILEGLRTADTDHLFFPPPERGDWTATVVMELQEVLVETACLLCFTKITQSEDRVCETEIM